MKNILLIISAVALFSCKKNASSTNGKIDSVKIIDSINKVRTKYNDSIRAASQYGDLSGNRKLTFSTDGASLSGNVHLQKLVADEYKISGSVKSGNNYVEINGTLVRVSKKYMNFYGKISQKINGNYFERTKNTTFADEEGKGKFWRLQSKINGDGFVDYLDLHY